MSEASAQIASSFNWRWYLLVFAAALSLYIVSLAPGVVWQDNGKAQIRVLLHDVRGENGLALSHPLYYLLAVAAQGFPLAESAMKTNLVSAVAGAVTVANVFLILQLMTGRWRGAVAGALSLAVAHTFWQHSSFAETYTLTAALLSAEFLFFLLYHLSGRTVWLIALLAANGLGISNHMLASLSLACYGVWLLCALVKRKVSPAMLPVLLAAWSAGAGIYLYLIAERLMAGDGLAATVHSALFGDFKSNVLNTTPSKRLLMNSVLYLGLNYPTPAVLLAIPGVQALRESRLRSVRVMLAALLLVYLAYAARYDIVDQYTFFVPALVFISMVLGLGADRFLERRSGRAFVAVLAATALPIAVYASLPTLAVKLHLNLGLSRKIPYRDEYRYFLQPWKTGYRGGEQFAAAVEETLPEGAVLLADSTAVRPIHYAQLTGRWHKAVEIDLPAMPSQRDSTRFTEQALQPKLHAGLVYVVHPAPQYCPRWVYERYTVEKTGPLYRIVGLKPATSSTPASIPH